MATSRKSTNPLAKAVARLGSAGTKLTRALEKLADQATDDSRTEVRTSRGGRTITVVNRGTRISRPKNRAR
jgi:hypothetical protein